MQSGPVHPATAPMVVSLTVRPLWYTFVFPALLTLGCLLTLEDLFSVEKDKALSDPVVYLALALLAIPVLLVRFLPQSIRLQNSGISFRYFLWPERIILWGGLGDVTQRKLRQEKALGWLTTVSFQAKSEVVTILGPPFYEMKALYTMVGKRTGREAVVMK